MRKVTFQDTIPPAQENQRQIVPALPADLVRQPGTPSGLSQDTLLHSTDASSSSNVYPEQDLAEMHETPSGNRPEFPVHLTDSYQVLMTTYSYELR